MKNNPQNTTEKPARKATSRTVAQSYKFGLHPLIIAAIVAVIALCGVGIYAMLHDLNSNAPEEAIASVEAPAPPPDIKEIAKEAAREVIQESKKVTPKVYRPAPPKAVAAPKEVVTIAKSATCYECGVVESINAIKKPGEGSGVGAVAGGALGGALGNQMGKGKGRTAMTVIGLVGGGLAGHEVEKRMQENFDYQMTIRFQDGTTQVFTQEQPFGFVVGDPVKVVNGQVVRR